MNEQIKKPNAFTLIEIIVVLIILGVLAALALPSYFSWISKTGQAQEAFGTIQSLKAQIVTCLRAHQGDEATCSSLFNGAPSACNANDCWGYASPSSNFRYLVHNTYCTNDNCIPDGNHQGWWIQAINDQSGLRINISGNGNDTRSTCWSERIINYVVVSPNEGLC